MDDLNNSQIILLAILASFVTSIATGIVTVSLMQEAPVSVTQTINRVVERTVEKVVPGTTNTVVREVSKVITVDDLVISAFKSASPAVVQVLTGDGKPLGNAFYVEGGALVGVVAPSADGRYALRNEDAKLISLTQVKRDPTTNLVRFDLRAGDGLTPITFSTSTVAAGQTVIGLGVSDDGVKTLAVGVISALAQNASSTPIIRTRAVSAANVGGPLVDVKGELVGVNAGEGEALESRVLKAFIDQS